MLPEAVPGLLSLPLVWHLRPLLRREGWWTEDAPARDSMTEAIAELGLAIYHDAWQALRICEHGHIHDTLPIHDGLDCRDAQTRHALARNRGEDPIPKWHRDDGPTPDVPARERLATRRL